MTTIYEKLFDTYGEAVLDQLDNFHDREITAWIESLPIDKNHQVDLYDRARQLYFQWSTDAFIVGLHLGLSLLDNEVRRARPQEGGQDAAGGDPAALTVQSP